MKTKVLSIVLVLFAVLLLVTCSAKPRDGELRTETQSVELGNAKSASVKFNLKAGIGQVNLEVE